MTTYRCTACSKDVEVEEKELMVIDPFDPLVVEVTPCETCIEAAEEAVKEESYDKGYQEGWQEGYDTATEEWENKAELIKTDKSSFEEDTSVKGVSTGRVYPLMSNIEEVEKGEEG